MVVYKIMYGGTAVVGIVVSKDGGTSGAAAMAAWNQANPSYAGDSVEEAPFLEVS